MLIWKAELVCRGSDRGYLLRYFLSEEAARDWVMEQQGVTDVLEYCWRAVPVESDIAFVALAQRGVLGRVGVYKSRRPVVYSRP